MDDDQDPNWFVELPELVKNTLDIIIGGCGCHMVCKKHGQDACGCLNDANKIIALVA